MEFTMARAFTTKAERDSLLLMGRRISLSGVCKERACLLLLTISSKSGRRSMSDKKIS